MVGHGCVSSTYILTVKWSVSTKLDIGVASTQVRSTFANNIHLSHCVILVKAHLFLIEIHLTLLSIMYSLNEIHVVGKKSFDLV